MHNGGVTGIRGRLGSDGSAQSSGSGLRGYSSTTSVERHSLSPPNTPPPPYTEFDSKYQQHQPHYHAPPPPPPPAQGSRHFSLSQQQEMTSTAYNSINMQRTRSHGQVPYRRGNIPRTVVTPSTPSVADRALPPGGGSTVTGGQGQGQTRVPSPIPLKSPSDVMGGGTLV